MGAWIETVIADLGIDFHGVAPVWVRGLKRHVLHRKLPGHGRRTRMGAWIETKHLWIYRSLNRSRTRMGAWIETVSGRFCRSCHRVAPVWVRGLKPCLCSCQFLGHSRTRMGAWIETSR